MSKNKNTDAFKHEIAVSDYVEVILGKKQILQDKNPNYSFTDILQNMSKKFKSTNSSSVCYCFSCRSILKP